MAEKHEKKFEDKVALITGAGSGIGRLTAELFAREGARVGCSDINEEALAKTVSDIEKAGGHALALAVNVADPDAARAIVARCADELGGIDVLANIAGTGSMRHTENVTVEEWNRILGVNLNGTFFMSQAALPHLLSRRRSAIVNVASLAGLIGQAYCAAYCASKAGVVSLTKVFAVEFAKRGLRTNCICPAGVSTPLISSFAAPENADPDLLSRLGLIPKMTHPEEVADTIAYLASAAARSINGVALPMDFGTAAA